PPGRYGRHHLLELTSRAWFRFWLGPARRKGYQELASAARSGAAGVESELLCDRSFRPEWPANGENLSSKWPQAIPKAGLSLARATRSERGCGAAAGGHGSPPPARAERGSG